MVERFGRYWLQEKIGGGDRADVYRATLGEDPEVFAFEVALKRLKPNFAGDPAVAAAFVSQAEVGKQMSHPNVIRVFDTGSEGGLPFIAMEYVVGTNLAGLIRELQKQSSQLPTDLAVFVAQQTLRALDYIHRATAPDGRAMALIHGHVAPANIYLSMAGEVKLSDPGVARSSSGTRGDGGPAYTSPEALAGQLGDQRMDVWSVAAVLFRLITGEFPYGLADDDNLLLGNVPKVTPAHKVAAGVDSALSAVLARALHKNIRKRPKDAVSLYRELRRYRESQGIHVDDEALGAFVRRTLGSEVPDSFFTAPPEEDFAAPAWQVPIERSMTQRIQIVRRREIRLYWFVVAAALGVGLALPIGLFFRPEKTSGPQEKPPPPQSTEQRVEQQQAEQPELEQPGSEHQADFGEHFDFADQEDLDLEMMPEQLRTPFRKEMRAGRSLSEQKEYGDAVKHYRNAIRVSPNNLAAKLGLANGLFFLQKYGEADQLVNEVLKRHPDNARGLLLRADLLRARNKSPEAKRAYERVVRKAPKSYQAKMARKILAEW